VICWLISWAFIGIDVNISIETVETLEEIENNLTVQEVVSSQLL
jgi:hypothetical protein